MSLDWTADLEAFLAEAMVTLTDREIAQQLTYITGEAISAGAVAIKRHRLGIVRIRTAGRRWGPQRNEC